MIKKPVLIALGFLSLFTQLGRAADTLSFFKNYFVTGDAVVAGVGLRGTGVSGIAAGTINMTTVPCIDGGVPSAGIVPCTTTGAIQANVVAAFLYWGTEETATNPAGSTGSFDGNPIVGKPLGNPNNPACSILGEDRAWGRVYRADVLRYLTIDPVNNIRIANYSHTVQLPDSGSSRSGPSVILTDGASLVVIYQIAALGNPAAAPLKAVVLYDGSYTLTADTGDMTQTIAGFYQASGSGASMTPIVGGAEAGFLETMTVSVTDNGVNNGSQPFSNPFYGVQGGRWDNPTLPLTLAASDSFAIDVAAGADYACLTFAAVVTSTPVVDTDSDGLLDVWETNGLHLNLGDGTPANPATFGGCADYPSDPCENLPAMGANPHQKDIFLEIDWLAAVDHVHTPKIPALTQIYAAFNAQNINIHFDVGTDPSFQSAGLSYIIPAAYAQGGLITDLTESNLLCPNAQVSQCDYSEPYAVLSYKTGFSAIKDGFPFLNIAAHFLHDRKDIFHYVLFSHALAGPFNAMGMPTTTDPSSVSGVADRPGGDVMVTLGLWRSDIPANDQTGSELVQAGTLMHELGHNLGLLHAGLYHVPNCMPNYPSSMNYLYQTRGLTDVNGNEQIDYSHGTLAQLNENNLALTPSLGTLMYRIRFYGPLSALDPPDGAALLHCDGTPITNGALEIRLENPTLTTPDWTNGVPGSMPDINFNGTIGDGVNVAAGKYFLDSNDWLYLNLQQIGARPNVNGLSTDVGAADLGAADLGAADLGAADLGAADLGAADLGAADLGAADLGAADLGDLDYDTATKSTVGPPTGVGVTSHPFNSPGDNTVGWTPPDTGHIDSYNVYRCAGVGCVPSGPVYNSVVGGVAMGNFVDPITNSADTSVTPCPASSTCYDTSYTYAVTSVVGGVESNYSITATGLVAHLYVVAANQTRVYGTMNPAFTFTTTGQDPGLSGTTTCSTTATMSSDVTTYPITCSGQTPIAGISYAPGVLSVTQATASITITPYNVISDTLPHTATGIATGVGGANLSANLNLTGTTHTAVGVYTGDPWSFSGGIDYFNAAGTVTDTISPNAAPFVTGFALNSPNLRNNFAGFTGMQLTVGAQALSVSSLGRVCVAGNSQTHTVKVVSASTNLDVPGASASVNMAGCTAGAFVYANLASPITLTAGSTYYLVSLEIANGDMWYETGTISTKADATVSNSAYFNGTNWITTGTTNTSYVPPNMQYAVIPPPSLPNFVLNYNLNNQGLRNDFAGFAGMNLRVGATALNVTSVGRVCTVGNSQSHTVKFVNATTGQDVASAVVNMVNCTPTRFVYAALASPVTLAANTQYYLVSQEFYAGDTWYDQATLSTKPDATVLSSVYWNGAGYVTNALNTSYVPPDFQYSLTSQPGTVTVTVGTIVPGPSFTVDGTSYTTTQTFTWVSNSQHTIATTTPQSGGTGSRYVFSSWSDGGALSHMVAPTVSTGYTANFTLQNLLTTNVAGSGDIVATPSSADGYYNSGTPVQLQANASAGSVFSSWSGDLSGAGNPQSLTMSAPHSVTATFSTIATGGTFLTSTPPAGATLRNDYPGYVGMKFTVGATALVVTQLGRWTVTGSAGTHIVKLVQASGTDVPGGSVTLNLAGAAGGQYTYAGLTNTVTLLANTSYFLMTQEFAGGDKWYDYSLVTAASAGAVNAPAYQQSNGTYITLASSSSSYGPPNFLFTTGNAPAPAPPPTVVINSPSAGTVSGSISLSATATPSITLTIAGVQFLINGANVGPLLTAAPYNYMLDTTTLANSTYTLTANAIDSAGSVGSSSGVVITVNNPSSLTTPLLTGPPTSNLRNDYAGFVGLEFTVGSTPIQVSQLGRWVVAGNTGTHKVKLVDAVTGLDVTGGWVSINTQTATAGQYAYAALLSPLTLSANHAYYLLTQETYAGDFWYDAGTVKFNSAVTINGPEYQQSNGSYVLLFSSAGSYGPVSLLFGTN